MINNKGFTLIEILVYMALVSIVSGFVILIVFQITNIQDRLREKIEAEDELNFILQKIDWVLQDANVINQPAVNSTSTTISITKNNFSQNPIVLILNATSGSIGLSRSGGGYAEINSQNTIVDKLIFEHIGAINGAPEAVKTTIGVHSKIYSKEIETIHYLRK